METDLFNIVTDVLQGDTLVAYLLIICLYYVNKRFHVEKGKR